VKHTYEEEMRGADEETERGGGGDIESGPPKLR
jgi:hypothetical protein